MATIIETQKHFVTIEFFNGETVSTYVSKDEIGMKYVIGQDGKKLLLNDCKIKKTETASKAVKTVKVEKEEKESFSFEVEYEHKGRVNGFAHTVKTVEAYSYEEAIEKINKSFGVIYDIAEA